jgi:hypothetical protein
LRTEKPILVAIVVKGFEAGRIIAGGFRTKCARIVGRSSDPAACFELITNPFDLETYQGLELIQRHGFTVAELPRAFLDGYHSSKAWHGPIHSDDWKIKLINTAVYRIKKQYEGTEGPMQEVVYDPEFARAVLEEINKRFPSPVQLIELKHSFESEPSNEMLLVALAALQRDGFIEGKSHFSHSTSQHTLDAMADIEITKEGRQHLSPAPLQTGRGVTNLTFNAPVGKVYSNSVDQSTSNFTITLPNLQDIEDISQGHPQLQAAAVEVRNAQQQGTSVLEKFVKWSMLLSSIEGLSEKVYQHYPEVAALIGRAAMLVKHFGR